VCGCGGVGWFGNVIDHGGTPFDHSKEGLWL
jgi:hypothetical protein